MGYQRFSIGVAAANKETEGDMAILYRGDRRRGEAWRSRFGERLPEVEFRMWPDVGDAGDVRFIATWEPIDDLGKRFPNLEVLFSTGAGVDQFERAGIPPGVQLVRLIDPAIIAGMREYATMATLLLFRHMLYYRQDQGRQVWQPKLPAAPDSVGVGVMGAGVLGRAVIHALRPFGFALRAWSRSAQHIAGAKCFAGGDALGDFIAGCNILICLLPLTDETRGILDRALFDAMPRGAGLINVGRGAHLCENDLLEALAAGQLSGAVLDVFHTEPLPPGHPFWAHERIFLTPHIAASTGYESAASVLIDNIRRYRRGEQMTGLVDLDSGY